MGKMNYTRVEQILEEGMRNLLVKNLLKKADVAQGKTITEKSGVEIVKALEIEVSWLKKKNPKVYKELDLSPKKLNILFEQADTLSERELDLAKKFLEKVRNCKASLRKKDEDLIDEEKKRHIHKRHNVNEKWLPLD